MINSQGRNYRDLFKKAPIGYVILDCGLNLRVYNKAFLRAVDERRKNILGRSFKEYINKDYISKFLLSIEALKRDKAFTSVSVYMENKDKKFYANLSMDIITLDNIEYIACVIVDISNEKTISEELKYLSLHDKLTGLYNRRFFEEELDRLDTFRSLPLTIVMADVNGLKLINDSFGHTEGDNLLKKVSKAFKRACREDDIIARIGGDEFIIILPNTGEKESEDIINRIKGELDREKSSNIEISVSFGSSTKYSVEEDIAIIYKDSEDQMYTNKLIESQEMRNKTIEKALISLYLMNSSESEHSKGVSELLKELAKEMDFNDLTLEEIEKVAITHDIGKISIDKNILLKIVPLTKEEREKISKHPEVGYHMLTSIHGMMSISKVILHHHEKWDGSGYPGGLKGDDIPLASRMLSICESYDYMINDTPYRKAFSKEYAVEELRKNRGTQFDPNIVDIFLKMIISQ
jgi:diguanylate cyclase (GGDEF)-like protein/PAS domain S-box-containing protein